MKHLQSPSTRPGLRAVVGIAAGLSLFLFLPSLGIGVETGGNRSSEQNDRLSGHLAGRVQSLVTGQYLSNARILVRGLGLEVFSDEYGYYRLSRLPAGVVELEVFYTGLELEVVRVRIIPGATVEQDVGLKSRDRYKETGEMEGKTVVELNPFVVNTAKVTEGDDLAINEQRFAPNMKNVVATDSLGDIMGANVGEFLKFLPGIGTDYSDVEVVGISMRGIGSDKTSFTVDGAPLANASTSSSRSVWLVGVDLTSAARMEITKVPTPSSPADSLAGSINMVSKNAFERRKAQLNYSVNMKTTSHDMTLKATPDSYEKYTKKARPGFSFDYTLPVSKTLGFVVTGMHDSTFRQQPSSAKNFSTSVEGTDVSIEKPLFYSQQLSSNAREHTQDTAGIKVDWRVMRNSVLSFSGRVARYKTHIGTMSRIQSAGIISTPNPANLANAVRMSFGEDFTIGASGRGSLIPGSAFQTIEGDSTSGNVQYRFDNGIWKIESGFSLNPSTRSRRNMENGHFASMSVAAKDPVRVTFRDITPNRPGVVEIYDNANRPVDPNNLENYVLSSVSDNPYSNRARIGSGYLDLKRSLDMITVPSYVQLGARQTVQSRDTRLESGTWNYGGLDGNSATKESPAPYESRIFRRFPSFGYSGEEMTFVSPVLMYDAWSKNPELFKQTTSQVVAQEKYRITNSEYIEEKVSAYYAQWESRFFKSRFRVLGGVRYEKTNVEGLGALSDPDAVWMRDDKGLFLRDAAGKRLRKSEAGAAGSMEELRLVEKERAFRADRTYDGYYPSVHLTYILRENLLVRAAYARTYGRPDFGSIIPRTTTSELNLGPDELDDPDIIRGTITLRNTGLKPWTADNYDFSVEYYSDKGGVISGSVFLKDIRDFFATRVEVANQSILDELGLDSRYLNWYVNTKFNSGDARVYGGEVDVRRSLDPLGSWGRHFAVFFNATRLWLEGHSQADFSNFQEKTANWGLTFKRDRLTMMLKWNYRGLNKQTPVPAMGDDAFQYDKARLLTDMNLMYQVTPRLAVSCSIGNVFNVPQVRQMYGSATPGYARQRRVADYGTLIGIGVKGSF